MEYTATTPVGQIVADRLSRAAVFEKLGIDYCCRGDRPLEEACRDKSVTAEDVLSQIREHDQGKATEDETNWNDEAMTDLVDHILSVHHAYLREVLPQLSQMTETVAAKHGEKHPELREVKDVFGGLRAELEAHMMKEEQILFPAIVNVDSGAIPAQAARGLAAPVHVMRAEHDSAGEALERMRKLTGGYAAPADACDKYRATLTTLQTLEDDLHRHIHKENNILFPRLLETVGVGV